MALLEAVNLKLTVSRVEEVTTATNVLGLVFYAMVLRRHSEEVVTDRIAVSDEAVKVIGLRR